MARSDLIINLVKASVRGDVADARAVAEAIAADERSKKHSGVADRISRALDTPQPPQRNGQAHTPGIRVRDGSGGVQRSEPRRPLSSLYLDESIYKACDELIEEQRRADVLRAYGLEPRHRLLLAGPPGNGKTSLAEAIAYELALPLFTVRYDAVVTSYLGETAQRLRRLFDFVRTEPCVLFFDEFDAIGKERGDIHETGEIKRVITTLLLQIDDLPSYCVLVGATNHPELLDRATWRRFELRLSLNAPSSKQMIKYFHDQLNEFEGQPGYTAKRLCESVAPVSFSEAEAFFLDVRRRIALAQGARELRSILDDRVKAFRSHSRARIEGAIDGGKTDPSVS
ncbi:AAA family ATPase [Ectothiorhodospira variabilis]|uniref:AAA family ATPase n=1 Tax=Ectothiorhodospira variabilis TaxID=505694 RepID=UPI001EFB26E0|nr:ATP-binding protein [Ectothiorhodospira variabilis]MCG5497160.1 ATP-binding protein [Ectothiorhodospira variabilis]